jgi:hypothetical protein
MSPATTLDPRVSEFETQEQADSYDRWFRARVEASLADERPRVPHAEAMARIRSKLVKMQSEVEKAAPPSDGCDA